MPKTFLLTLSLKWSSIQDNISKKQFPVVFNQIISSSNRTLFIRILLYVIGLIQIGLLYYWTVDSLLVCLLNLLLFSLVYTGSFPLIGRLMVPSLVDHIWVTWIIGGIGMLLGHVLDTSYSHGVKHMHHHSGVVTGLSSSELFPLLLSGMTITMLIFCIPACLYVCNRCLLHYKAAEKWGLHCGSSIFMLFGMLFASYSEPLFFTESNGFGYVSYYFMLSLMVCFSSSAYYLISKKIDSKPLKSGVIV